MSLFYYSFVVSFNKFGRISIIIDNPFAQICVPDKIKNMNVKLFSLISRVNKISE